MTRRQRVGSSTPRRPAFRRGAILLESVFGVILAARSVNAAGLSFGRIEAQRAITHAPGVLRELFDALGNDPNRIAGTPVRGKLVDSRVRAKGDRWPDMDSLATSTFDVYDPTRCA